MVKMVMRVKRIISTDCSIRGALAPDIIRMADRKALDVDAPPPSVLEVLDAVGSEDEVKVEGRGFSTKSSDFPMKR